MAKKQLYAKKFQRLDDAFSSFASNRRFTKKVQVDFDATIGEAGRIAWMASIGKLLPEPLQVRVREAEDLWREIERGRKRNLYDYIYDKSYERLDEAARVDDSNEAAGSDLGSVPTTGEIGEYLPESFRSSYIPGHRQVIYKQKIFYSDYLNLAQHRFWTSEVVPYLRQYDIDRISVNGALEDSVVSWSPFKWPERIVVPYDPFGCLKKIPNIDMQRMMNERAKAYSDACRVLADLILPDEANLRDEITLEQAVDRYFGELFYPDLRKSTVRSRIVRAYTRKQNPIKSRQVGSNRMLDMESFKAFLLAERNRELRRSENGRSNAKRR